MVTITENMMEEQDKNKKLKSFINTYGVGNSLKQSNAYKTKGIPVTEIFMYLIQLVFTKKSIYMNILNGTHDAGFSKNTVYRWKNEAEQRIAASLGANTVKWPRNY